MPTLLAFVTALALLPSVSLAVAPAQVPPNGKAHGFISNLDNLYPEPTGDWLTSTFCFCHSPVHAKKIFEYEKAHIFQHEYYNYHSNATFVVDHMCLSKAHYQGDQCRRPNVGGDNSDWLLDAPYVCKKFPRTEEESIRQGNSKRSTRKREKRGPPFECLWNCDPGAYDRDPPDPSSHRHQDKVCFATDTSFYGTWKMEMKFNEQHRKMYKPGAQGRVQSDPKEVQGYCEDMCQKTFGMPVDMKINDKRADGGSRQYLYTSLDDMCDHCK